MKAIAIFFFILLVSTVGCARQYAEQTDDLHREQEVSRNLLDENAVLREVNDNLRRQVVVLSENLSRTQAILDKCGSACPANESKSTDLPSPIVRIPLSDVLIMENKVIIDIPDVQHGIVSASKSMDPFLDENTVVLEITPKNAAEIHLGDIIIYKYGGERVIHRVVSIGHDDDGWFAITKGDNNLKEDPEKVRFEQVAGIVVGIIY
jgi:signal peptidase I